MVIKLGRYGKFYACSNFPDCRNTKAIVKEIGVTCPVCHEGQVIERKSKKNRIFYGCSRYPECDFLGQTSRPTMSKMWAIFSREKLKAANKSFVSMAIMKKTSKNKKIETEEFTSVFSLVK